MVYARVVRAMGAIDLTDSALEDANAHQIVLGRLVDSLNQEFRLLAVSVEREDLAGTTSALEIARMVTSKLR